MAGSVRRCCNEPAKHSETGYEVRDIVQHVNRVLDQAAGTAALYGLVHQLRSIEGIKAGSEGPTGPRQR